jgi:hypothetical protein
VFVFYVLRFALYASYGQTVVLYHLLIRPLSTFTHQNYNPRGEDSLRAIVLRHALERQHDVVVQVEFESKGLKPTFSHFSFKG